MPSAVELQKGVSSQTLGFFPLTHGQHRFEEHNDEIVSFFVLKTFFDKTMLIFKNTFFVTRRAGAHSSLHSPPSPNSPRPRPFLHTRARTRTRTPHHTPPPRRGFSGVIGRTWRATPDYDSIR